MLGLELRAIRLRRWTEDVSRGFSTLSFTIRQMLILRERGRRQNPVISGLADVLLIDFFSASEWHTTKACRRRPCFALPSRASETSQLNSAWLAYYEQEKSMSHPQDQPKSPVQPVLVCLATPFECHPVRSQSSEDLKPTPYTVLRPPRPLEPESHVRRWINPSLSFGSFKREIRSCRVRPVAAEWQHLPKSGGPGFFHLEASCLRA